MIQFLKQIFTGPVLQPDHLIVRFYLSGGQVITAHHVEKFTSSKTAEGGFASYAIVWHDGFKPPMFSLTLDHISAIEVLKG